MSRARSAKGFGGLSLEVESQLMKILEVEDRHDLALMAPNEITEMLTKAGYEISNLGGESVIVPTEHQISEIDIPTSKSEVQTSKEIVSPSRADIQGSKFKVLTSTPEVQASIKEEPASEISVRDLISETQTSKTEVTASEAKISNPKVEAQTSKTEHHDSNLEPQGSKDRVQNSNFQSQTSVIITQGSKRRSLSATGDEHIENYIEALGRIISQTTGANLSSASVVRCLLYVAFQLDVNYENLNKEFARQFPAGAKGVDVETFFINYLATRPIKTGKSLSELTQEANHYWFTQTQAKS